MAYSLPSAEKTLARVQERVRLGGHDVPAPVVRRRYVHGLRNFFSIYRDIADTWQLLDNSHPDAYELIAFGESDARPTIIAQSGWSNLLEQAR